MRRRTIRRRANRDSEGLLFLAAGAVVSGGLCSRIRHAVEPRQITRARKHKYAEYLNKQPLSEEHMKLYEEVQGYLDFFLKGAACTDPNKLGLLIRGCNREVAVMLNDNFYIWVKRDGIDELVEVYRHEVSVVEVNRHEVSEVLVEGLKELLYGEIEEAIVDIGKCRKELLYGEIEKAIVDKGKCPKELLYGEIEKAIVDIGKIFIACQCEPNRGLIERDVTLKNVLGELKIVQSNLLYIEKVRKGAIKVRKGAIKVRKGEIKDLEGAINTAELALKTGRKLLNLASEQTYSGMGYYLDSNGCSYKYNSTELCYEAQKTGAKPLIYDIGTAIEPRKLKKPQDKLNMKRIEHMRKELFAVLGGDYARKKAKAKKAARNGNKNGRKQKVTQDEIEEEKKVLWSMHASVNLLYIYIFNSLVGEELVQGKSGELVQGKSGASSRGNTS